MQALGLSNYSSLFNTSLQLRIGFFQTHRHKYPGIAWSRHNAQLVLDIYRMEYVQRCCKPFG